MPLVRTESGLALRLFSDADVPAIAQLLDTIVAARGEPWRVALERLERIPPTSRAQRGSLTAAVRRLLGRTHAVRATAREVRARVLAQPVLDPAARTARIAAAARDLAMTPAQVEAAMWSDLALERPVELPDGRPAERTVAAYANLDAIQHALRRAHLVKLRVWDDPRELWRIAAVRGLLTTVVPVGDGSTRFEIRGPLALFHQTAVYGRALAALVPPLAEQPRFELAIHCDLEGPRVLRVVPPVLLPAAPPPRRPPMALDARLARDLEPSTWLVTREPEPIAAGGRLLFPHLRLDGPARWYVEIIGFATTDFLADKVARYRAAGLPNLLLCIDADRAAEGETAPDGARVIWFRKRVDAASVLEMIG